MREEMQRVHQKCIKEKLYLIYNKKVYTKYNEVMTSQSDNQVIATCARTQERQGQGRLDSGPWNGCQSQPTMMNGVGGGFIGGFNKSMRFNRRQILDERSRKFETKVA